MNKKGTDKILSMYWFVILVIVAGGIFAMVYNFYGAPYDVRGVESEILAEKIADCISKNGIIDSEFFIEEDFNEEIGDTFMEKCNFNFNVESGYGEDNEIQYFYRVEFYTLEEMENPKFNFYGGNKNWENDCFIVGKDDEEYSRLAKCTEKRFYALKEGKDQYLIKILSVVGKSEKNVKQ